MKGMNEKYLPAISRLLLGVIFVVFGLNGFLDFIPMPAMPDAAAGFMGALAATGYMFPLIKIIEIVSGLLLLFNRYVPLALALLAPGIVNIALFHAFLAPAGILLAALVFILEVYLAWSYRDLYRPMLTSQVVPTARKRPEQRFHHDRTAVAQH